MIKIGLTGGIGSGKSTVSFMLKEAGFEVVDADVIAKEVLVKYPEILEKVKIEFGSGFFDWRGEFRRKEFGNHIFRFPKQRKKYEEIILPYIKNEIKDTLNKLEENKTKTKIKMLRLLVIPFDYYKPDTSSSGENVSRRLHESQRSFSLFIHSPQENFSGCRGLASL